jgi:UrcA family protein
MRLPRLLILCAAMAAVAAPASAGGVRPAKDIADAYEMIVGYADLDLDRPAGADALIARIKQAARAVCGEPSDPRDLAGKARARHACVAVTMEGAIGRVDAPLVTARYERSKSAAMLAQR